MRITVKDLLAMEVYKEAILVGGGAGLDNEVNGITIMEDATINEWLRGKEALLTSLLPLKDYTDGEITTFLNGLVKNKVSAVIVKIGKAVDKIPSGLIKWGDENAIPIIQLPRHVFYTDLMYPVMAELIESQLNRLTYYKSVHEKFRDMSIKSSPMKMVIEVLSDIIKNPVAIYDRNHNLIMGTSKDFNGEKIYSNLKKHPLGKGYKYIDVSLDGDKVVCQLMIEISVLENTKSYLAILEKNKKIDQMDLLAIENACTNISLKMVQDIAVKEVEERFMNDIINDLIFGSPILSNPLLERANIAGIDVFESYVVVVMDLKLSLEKIKRKLKKHLATLVKKYKGAYSLKSDSVIILLNIEKDMNSSEFEEIIKQELFDMGKGLQAEF